MPVSLTAALQILPTLQAFAIRRPWLGRSRHLPVQCSNHFNSTVRAGLACTLQYIRLGQTAQTAMDIRTHKPQPPVEEPGPDPDERAPIQEPDRPDPRSPPERPKR